MTGAIDQIPWLGGGVAGRGKRSSPGNRAAVSNVTFSVPAGIWRHAAALLRTSPDASMIQGCGAAPPLPPADRDQ